MWSCVVIGLRRRRKTPAVRNNIGAEEFAHYLITTAK